MLDHGLDANLKGSAGVTLLHVAAMCAKPLIVKKLLESGADPTCKDDAGKAPLDLAQDDVVRSLLNDCIANGKPNMTDDHTFDLGEQVFCRDKNGAWWPAVTINVQPGGL